MHTSTLANQIRLARAINVPKSKIDTFISHTRKRPIHTIIDLEHILSKMRFNDKRQKTMIVNAYLKHMSNKKKRTIRKIVKNRPSNIRKRKKTTTTKKPKRKMSYYF
jgi:hypothetical protein